MDPLAITSAVAALVTNSAKLGKNCNDYWNKYKVSSITLPAIVTECNTISISLSQIHALFDRDPDRTTSKLSNTPHLIPVFENALVGCGIVLSVIDDEIEKLSRSARKGKFPRMARIKYVWNEAKMKELLSQVRGQQAALQALLDALQLKAIFQIQDFLKIHGNVLNQIARKAFSLRSSALEDGNSLNANEYGDRDPSVSAYSTLSEISDTEFTFDEQLINTKAYRAAFANYQREAKLKRESSSPIHSIEEVVVDLNDNATIKEQAENSSTPTSDSTADSPSPPLPQNPQNRVQDSRVPSLILEKWLGEGVDVAARDNYRRAAIVPAKHSIQNPSVVVGIDFGMSSTAVAFSILESNSREWLRPETLQHWPYAWGTGLADKVNTALAYDIRTDEVAAWGFSVDLDDPRYRIEELFKLYLVPEYRDEFQNAPTLEEARRWFTDYLACVYRHINRHFRQWLPQWNTKRVEWVFSVPTTWKNPAMIAETEQLIRNAGFGREQNHNLEITLTEAEAVAVYASKNQYQKGDVFLVCDAGEGTTDVNIFKMTSADMGHRGAQLLLWIEGSPIGSTLIDFKVEKLLTDRLESIRNHLQAEPRIIAKKMLRTRFETFRRLFGIESMNIVRLPLYVTGLCPGMDFPAARIEDSHMIVTREELQHVFDEQIERLFNLIDEQLRKLQQTHVREKVRYLVLSGDLGSMPYVRKKLRSRYEMEAGSFSNAQGIVVLNASKPQLAVVHGLVMDRVQQVREGSIEYKERC